MASRVFRDEALLEGGRAYVAAKLPYLSAALYALTVLRRQGMPSGMAVTRHGVLLADLAVVARWYAGPHTDAEHALAKAGTGANRDARTGLAKVGFGLAHEVLHLLLDHAGRGDKVGATTRALHRLWNLANDFVVNTTLRAAGLIPLPTDAFPEAFGLPPDLSSEEYYVLLRKRQGEAPEPDGHGCGACGSGAGGEPAEGEPEAPTPKDEEAGRARSGAGRTPLELEAVRRDVAAAMRAYQAGGKGAVPAGWLLELAELLRPPVVPWEEVLRARVRGSLEAVLGHQEAAYDRPSKRQGGLGWGAGACLLPRLVDPVPAVAVLLDTSGSMTAGGRLARGCSEIVGVLAATGAALTVIGCDAAVHAVTEIATAEALLASLAGGGGTDMQPGIEAAEALPRRPDLLIIVTDLEIPHPGEAPPFEALWVDVSEGGGYVPPWGEVVRCRDGATP